MKHGVPVVFTLITGITFVTSAAGVIKVAGNISSSKPSVPEIKTVQEALQEDSNLSKLDEKKPLISPTPTVIKTKNITNSSNGLSPTPSLTQHVKLGVSVQGDDEEKEKDGIEKLEIDNDIEVSHQDDQSNQENNIQEQENKNISD